MTPGEHEIKELRKLLRAICGSAGRDREGCFSEALTHNLGIADRYLARCAARETLPEEVTSWRIEIGLLW